jgi:hypothetical protein
VAAKLDGAASQKATAILAKAKAGDDFSELAKKYSEDPAAKETGGDYGFGINRTNPNVPPEVVQTLFSLKKGEVSDIILASPVLAGQGPSLQIVKLSGKSGDTVTAQYIVVHIKDANNYIKDLKSNNPPHYYVHF